MADQNELAVVLQRLIAMVSSVELMTGALAEVLVENGVIDRGVLLKGLIAKRAALDPKFSTGAFDAVIAALHPKPEGGPH